MSTSKFPKCLQHQTGAAGFRAEGGQALIESVVTFGLLITLVVAIVNFGFIFRTLISVRKMKPKLTMPTISVISKPKVTTDSINA